MQKKIQDFLKELNNGRLYNSQQFIAKKLGVDTSSVSKWCTGKTKPSEENIFKMAKISNKTPAEIEKIFFSNSGVINTGKIEKNSQINNIQNSSVVELLEEKIKTREEKIKFLEEKIKFLEEKIKFLESKRK